MFQRLLSPLRNESFFLFGARGTGKSTYLKEQFGAKNPYWIDLLNPDQEDHYLRDPMWLERELVKLIADGKRPDWVMIDEVQKAPRLLDVVHRLIENTRLKFALTGSSSRKLKRGHANLLAGRSFLNILYPLTHLEMKDDFSLDTVLNWGSLPKLVQQNSDRSRLAYLRTYCQVYLKEEVLVEQLVRNLLPFKGFLELSAQMNAEILNYEKIAKQIGVDNKTVQSYFDILEETYLGARLPAHEQSIRKSQMTHPKFYWLDLGVQRSLAGMIRSTLLPHSFGYGKAFETFIINELIRVNQYWELDYKFSYFQSKHGAEIDLLMSRGRESIAIEIKSSRLLDLVEVKKFSQIVKGIPWIKRAFYLSQNENSTKVENIHCVHWQKIFDEINK